MSFSLTDKDSKARVCKDLLRLEHFVSEILASVDMIQLSKSVQLAFLEMGFDDIVMSTNRRDARDLILDPDLNSRSDSFIREFERGRWFERDPTISRSMQEGRAFWTYTSTSETEPLKRERSEFLIGHNIRFGSIFPLASKEGRFSNLAATSSTQFKEDPLILVRGSILASAAAMKVELLGKSRVVSSDQAQGVRLLSAQQIEILKWVREGKSNSSIAIIMGLSKAGVDYHVKAIISKLGVASRTQAALMVVDTSIV